MSCKQTSSPSTGDDNKVPARVRRASADDELKLKVELARACAAPDVACELITVDDIIQRNGD